MERKEAVKRSFGRYATTYDAYASVQDRVGAELLRRWDGREQRVARILDVGCGTGSYTQRLARRFPRAAITAVDLCPAMIRVARGKIDSPRVRFVAADAEMMALTGPFDLITANACFQWFNDLPAALARYRAHLAPEGRLLFSTFGPHTFFELRAALAQVWGQATPIAADRFPDARALRRLLRRSFNEVQIAVVPITQSYDSVRSLLSAIKYTGTYGPGLAGRTFGKRELAALERLYTPRHPQVVATYEACYCLAHNDARSG